MKVSGSILRVHCAGLRNSAYGAHETGAGLRVQGLGSRVPDSEVWIDSDGSRGQGVVV